MQACKELEKRLKSSISLHRSKQLTNNRNTTLTSDSGEYLSTPDEIAYSLNTYIGVDKASLNNLNRCKAALSRPLLIIFQESFSEGIVPYQCK